MQLKKKLADKIKIDFDLEVYEISEINYESVDNNSFLHYFLKISIDDNRVRTNITTEPKSAVLRLKKSSFIRFLVLQSCNIIHNLLSLTRIQYLLMKMIIFIQSVISKMNGAKNLSYLFLV